MSPQQPRMTVARYFAGLTESTFQTELGVADPLLIDYVTDLLIRFVRTDVINRVRSVSGKPLMTVTEMAAEAASRMGSARRELHRHIGDFTLFWAGVYPEALHDSHGVDDQFSSYCCHGKRSYHLASQIDSEPDTQPDATVLQRLSERFELCCFGLREIRRNWEEQDLDGPGLLLLG